MKHLKLASVESVYIPIKFRDSIISVKDVGKSRLVTIAEKDSYGTQLTLYKDDLKDMLPILQEIVSD